MARQGLRGLISVPIIIYFVALTILTVYVFMQSTGLIINFMIITFAFVWVFSIIYLLIAHVSG